MLQSAIAYYTTTYMDKQLTHIDDAGRVKMVDVGHKSPTERVATARGAVIMAPTTLRLIIEGEMKKGDVLTVAELAGIMAAKRTSDLIPLCHPLQLSKVDVTCSPNEAASRVDIEATVKTVSQTGVEMEALTAVSVAALTIYDMGKAVDRAMRLSDIRVVYKTGGQSGTFQEE